MKQFVQFFFVLLLATGSLAQVNLNLGLQAYYPFDGNANDISGNSNNPVFNNASLTNDRFGNANRAYHFNGTNTYMQVTNSASLNSVSTLSISAWVRPTGFYSGTCHGNAVVMKGNADHLPGNYFLRFDDGFYYNYTHCANPVNTSQECFNGTLINIPAPGYLPKIQANEWYNVILTYDGTTAKLYVNCELKYSGPQNGVGFTNADDLFFGKLNNGSFPYWFNGDVDDIRIYNRALNVDEVKAIGGCGSIVNCNNWLKTQVVGESVKI